MVCPLKSKLNFKAMKTKDNMLISFEIIITKKIILLI